MNQNLFEKITPLEFANSIKKNLKNGNVILYVTVTPKSQKNIIQNIELDKTKLIYHIKAKIQGIPENNQVNKNLLRFIGKTLHIGISQIQFISGFHSRNKILQINQNAL